MPLTPTDQRPPHQTLSGTVVSLTGAPEFALAELRHLDGFRDLYRATDYFSKSFIAELRDRRVLIVAVDILARLALKSRSSEARAIAARNR